MKSTTHQYQGNQAGAVIMRKLTNYPLGFLTLAFAVLAITACLFVDRQPMSPQLVYAEFAKKVSVTGGSPAKRLSSSLSAAGYVGASQVDEITICVPSTNTNVAYLGSDSTTNASTGFPIQKGECFTQRSAGRAIDVSRLYIFEATTESLSISLRER